MLSRFPRLLRLTAAAAIAVAPLTGPLLGRPVAAAQVANGTCAVTEAELPLDVSEQAMLAQINAYRVQMGRDQLVLSTTLTKAALWKSEARKNGASENHDDDNGRTWDQRLIDCGYDPFAMMGENIGRVGGVTPDEVSGLLQAWKDSPIHNEVMLTAEFRAIGLARTVNSEGVSFWTAVFGSVTDDQLPSAASTPTPTADPAPPADPAPMPEPPPAEG